MNENQASFCEATFYLDTEFRQFLAEELSTPIDLVSMAVSRAEGQPVVHVIVDGLAITRSMRSRYRMTPIETPYRRPGFTPIAAAALDRRTGLELVVTDASAEDNPHMEAFEDLFFDAVFEDDIVRADPHENTVNVFMAPTHCRTLFARSGGKRASFPFSSPKDLRFAITDRVVLSGEPYSKIVYGMTLEEVQSVLLLPDPQEEDSPRVSWRQVTELPYELLSFSRPSKEGKLVLTMMPPVANSMRPTRDHLPLVYACAKTMTRPGKVVDGVHLADEILFSFEKESLATANASNMGMILGPTTCRSENDEPRLAVTFAGSFEDIEGIRFLPYAELAEPIRLLVEKTLPVRDDS